MIKYKPSFILTLCNEKSLIHIVSRSPLNRKETLFPPGRGLHQWWKKSIHSSSSSYALKKDPYEVLNVDRRANASAIKKAYFDLAKKYHPDSNKEKDATEKFHEIQDAYELLSDEKKRAIYDQFGHRQTDTESRSDGGFEGFHTTGTMDPSDVFKAFFGGTADGFASIFGKRAGFGAKSDSPFDDLASLDIKLRLSLTFMEAAKGTTKMICFARLAPCEPCRGTGIVEGRKLSVCRRCDGRGTQVLQRAGMIFEMPCEACDGEGKINKDPCLSCRGTGSIKKKAELEVKIPSGIDESSHILLRGAGHYIQGRKGNVRLHFEIAPSHVFRREGPHLYIQRSIPFTTAILGGSVRVPTLSEDVEVVVPPGTQPEETKKLKGRGIYDESNRIQGDQFITFKILLPKTLSPRQRQLLEEFDGSGKDRGPVGKASEESLDGCKEGHKLKDWIKSKISGSD